jgi:hypothetical protein
MDDTTVKEYGSFGFCVQKTFSVNYLLCLCRNGIILKPAVNEKGEMRDAEFHR